MPAAYTKEFLLDAYISRFPNESDKDREINDYLRLIADKFYDKVGKDKFRQYASLDAAAIKEFKNGKS